MNFKIFFITKGDDDHNWNKASDLMSLLPEGVSSCLERVNAIEDIDGSGLEFNPVGLINKLYMKLNPESVSRYLTHHYIYNRIVEDQIDAAFIVEDEINFGDLINFIIINPDFSDWVSLSNMSTDGIEALNAYYVSKSGAKRLLDLLNDTRWLNAIKRFTPADYGIHQSNKEFEKEPLQDFSLQKCIIAPIDKLIHFACVTGKIPFEGGPKNFINKSPTYKTFKQHSSLDNLHELNIPDILSDIERPEKPLIEKIFYINLDSNRSKKNHAENMLAHTKVPFERFRAIRPTQKDIDPGGQYADVFSKSKILEARSYFKEPFDFLDVKKYELGTLGCYLSHYLLLKKINLSCGDMDYVAIIEDDCYLNEDSLRMASEAIKNLLSNSVTSNIYGEGDWDILRSTWSAPDNLERINYSHPLSNSYDICMQREIFNKIKSYTSKYPSVCPVIHTFCGGTHFQVINVKSIPKILDYLDSEVLLPIDCLYNTTKLNIYNKKMNISHDVFSDSSIQVRKDSFTPREKRETVDDSLLEKIFVINLKEKQSLFSKFESIKDHRIERFEAIDSRKNLKIHNEYGLSLNPVGLASEFYFSESLGALGCYLSHYSIWKKMIEENIKSALILEEDVRVEDVENLLNRKYLFEHNQGIIQFNNRTYCDFLKTGNFFNGTESYFLNLDSAKKLVALTHDRDCFQNIIKDLPLQKYTIRNSDIFKYEDHIWPRTFDMYKNEPEQDWTVKNAITCAVDKFIGYCADLRLPESLRVKIKVESFVELSEESLDSTVCDSTIVPHWKCNEQQLIEIMNSEKFRWWRNTDDKRQA